MLLCYFNSGPCYLGPLLLALHDIFEFLNFFGSKFAIPWEGSPLLGECIDILDEEMKIHPCSRCFIEIHGCTCFVATVKVASGCCFRKLDKKVSTYWYNQVLTWLFVLFF